MELEGEEGEEVEMGVMLLGEGHVETQGTTKRNN